TASKRNGTSTSSENKRTSMDYLITREDSSNLVVERHELAIREAGQRFEHTEGDTGADAPHRAIGKDKVDDTAAMEAVECTKAEPLARIRGRAVAIRRIRTAAEGRVIEAGRPARTGPTVGNPTRSAPNDIATSHLAKHQGVA